MLGHPVDVVRAVVDELQPIPSSVRVYNRYDCATVTVIKDYLAKSSGGRTPQSTSRPGQPPLEPLSSRLAGDFSNQHTTEAARDNAPCDKVKKP